MTYPFSTPILSPAPALDCAWAEWVGGDKVLIAGHACVAMTRLRPSDSEDESTTIDVFAHDAIHYPNAFRLVAGPFGSVGEAQIHAEAAYANGSIPTRASATPDVRTTLPGFVRESHPVQSYDVFEVSFRYDQYLVIRRLEYRLKNGRKRYVVKTQDAIPQSTYDADEADRIEVEGILRYLRSDFMRGFVWDSGRACWRPRAA